MKFRIIHTIEVEAVEETLMGPSPAEQIFETLLAMAPEIIRGFQEKHAQENSKQGEESSKVTQEASGSGGIPS